MYDESVLSQKKETKTWVDFLGFQFDPFQHLNASDDPHLGEYIVDLEKFTGAWENHPALIFAPAGGGKTTLRIYTYRTCWVGRNGLHPFPVQYYLPLINDHTHWADSLEKNLKHAVANALLISLSFRPERLKSMPGNVQEKVAVFLRDAFGADGLSYYLSVLEQELNPAILAAQIDRTYTLPDPPSPDSVQYFCSTLSACLLKKDPKIIPAETIDQISELIIQDLQFDSMYLLIDGVDGSADSLNEPRKASAQVNRLLKKTMDWAGKGIYIKVFLPEETEAFIKSNWLKSYIKWTPDSLANVIKQRILIASGNQFGSLNGVSGIGLRNEYIEQTLAENVIPLPREIIFAVQKLFEAYEQRSNGVGKIEPEDLDVALINYREDIKRRHISFPAFTRPA